MAAAAHTIPGFEFATADDDNMDLHSDDGGIDFDDGDIDLDLDPPPPQPQDEEMSMNDAASVNDVDAQTVPGEQDDFMVDQEDVIEDDYSFQEDQGVTLVDQPVVQPDQSAQPTQSPQPAAVNLPPIQTNTSHQDDDLIDYSEEEGDDYHNPELRSPWLRTESYASYYSDAQAVHDELPKEMTEQQDEIPADLQALLPMSADIKSPSPHREPQTVADDSPTRAAAHGAAPSPHPQSVDENEEDSQNDDGDGGVMLPGQEQHADGETQDQDSTHHGYEQEATADDSEHHDSDSSEFPSVTVNLHGEEYWLFKQHDYDNSGDWLIQDISLAKASLSDLFQACRMSLCEDVSNETEIGFKFEHLQNLEIFEDNTACVAVSLERLVGYYRSLHAQDGNNNPDSFYISLMLRPRFATLLSDIAKFADQGSGYSAFEAAVVAGETHFAGMIVGASSDEPTEWDTQEQESAYGEQREEAGDHVEEPESANAEAQASEHDGKGDHNKGEDEQEAHGGEHDDEAEDEQEAHSGEGVDVHEVEHTSVDHASYDELNQNEEPAEQNAQQGDGVEDPEREEVDVAHLPEEELAPAPEESHSVQAANSSDISTNPEEVVEQPQQESPKPSEKTDAESEALRLQEQDDLIDYSDEEDEPAVDVKGPEDASANEPSPSSATLQGDESANADGHDFIVGSSSHNEDAAENAEEAGEDAHGEVVHDQTEGNDDNEQSYQDFVQAFDEEDPFQDFQADGTDDYGADAYDGDTNQDFATQEYQDLDEQADLDFMNGDEFNVAGADVTDGNDVNGTDDFLDLENNPEWDADPDLAQEGSEMPAIAHDHTDAQDGEDGVAGQTANATSSAADPTTASSNDTNDVSPQGQKRSIDEAGHGADIASDSIGKLTIFIHRRNSCADYLAPDAKRPRV